MKTKHIVIALLAFASTAAFAQASEVTGQLSAGPTFTGSEVSGTLGGSSSGTGTVTGTVTGGSSGGGNGSIGIVSTNSVVSSGGGSISVVSSGGGSVPGQVLGASTEIPSDAALTDGTDRGGRLAIETGPVSTVVSAPSPTQYTAAAVNAGFSIPWWSWLLIVLVIAGAGFYGYRRYYQ